MTIKFLHPNYTFLFEVKSIVNSLEALRINIDKAFILNSGTMDNHLFMIPVSADYSIERSLFELMREITGESNIWRICETAFIKDEDWGIERNRGLLYEAYHKFTLNPKYVELVLSTVDQWISETKSIMEQMAQDENQKKVQRDAYHKKYSIIVTYKHVNPAGGENGVDGYFDGLIKNSATGSITQLVARNVFDFGLYVFPKRVGGSDDVFLRDAWSEEEREACDWLAMFPPFTAEMRM